MTSSSPSTNSSPAQQPEWLKPNAIPISAQDVQQKYDRISETYDAFTHTAQYQAPAAAIAHLKQFVADTQHSLAANSAILDAGCGTGLVGQALAEGGFVNLTGCDISQNCLQQAESKAVYTHLVQANLLEPFPFTPEQFAAVLCIGVFSRFDGEQILAILLEFVKVTQPQGLLMFSHRTDLLQESGLLETLAQHPQFKVEQVSQPSPYLPGLAEYENIDIQYVILTKA
ncbi:MAG: class I SAM-dependent methyltransferase [Spirulina sp. SIO3F2]|nr:class I SAM-dependent methyltransferase [Spirulina sp. SIO3F2]